MSIDFPASPVDQQLFTTAGNGVVYKYSAAYSSWLAQNPAAVFGGTGDFTATYTGSNAGLTTTPVVVAYNSVLSGNAGSWYNVSGRFTPPAGRYAISAGLSLLAVSTTITACSLALRKNGTNYLIGATSPGAASGYYSLATVAGNVDANGSDYFDITIAASVNGQVQFVGTSENWFSAFPLTGMQGPTGPVGPVGLLSGAGPPTGLTATKGTLYTNTTATTTTTRLYINTDGGTTWANFTASA